MKRCLARGSLASIHFPFLQIGGGPPFTEDPLPGPVAGMNITHWHSKNKRKCHPVLRTPLNLLPMNCFVLCSFWNSFNG